MIKPPSKRRTCRMGVWLTTAVLVGGAAAVFGQGPALEEWRGNRHMGKAQPVMIPAPPHPAYSTLPAQTRSVTLPPLAIAPPLRPVPMPPPAPATKARPISADIQRLGHSTGQLISEVCEAIDTYRDGVHRSRQRFQAAGEALAMLPPTPSEVRLVPVPRTITQPDSERPARRRTEPAVASGGGWAQVGLIAAATMMGPMLVVLAGALLLRRNGVQFRVEVINPTAQGPLIAHLEPGWAVAPTPAPTPAPVGPDVQEVVVPPEPDYTGEQFDLGPTYEEEQEEQAQAALQKEQAVLQQIFEQNVRLREDIAALEPEGEQEPEPAAA